jgi:hypothetical protein
MHGCDSDNRAARWPLKSRQWERLRALEWTMPPAMSSVMFMQLTRHGPAPLEPGQRIVVDYEEQITGTVQWRYRAAEDPGDAGRCRAIADGYLAQRASLAHARSLRPLPWDSALLSSIKDTRPFIWSFPYRDEQARRGNKGKGRLCMPGRWLAEVIDAEKLSAAVYQPRGPDGERR